MKKSGKIKLLLSLFLSFLKVGAFTFGGGYAMIALIENEFVQKKKWISHEEFLDIAAIAESTPGPLAINSATYIGYKTAGVAGSIVSTIGMVLPSLTVIYIISLFFDRFLKIKYVGYAFKGIQAGVIYLILHAGFKMFKALKKSLFDYMIFGAVLSTILVLSLFKLSFSSIYFILISGALGIIAYLFERRKGGDGK